MSAFEMPSSAAINRRLQGVLLLMVAWNLLALVAELTFGGALFETSGEEVGGIFAAKGSFSGAALVPLSIYVYAIVRGPLRHRGVLWVAAIEQGAAVLLAVYHVAANDIAVGGAVAPLVVGIVLLVLLLISLPRGQVTT